MLHAWPWGCRHAGLYGLLSHEGLPRPIRRNVLNRGAQCRCCFVQRLRYFEEGRKDLEPGPFFVLLVEDDINDEALVHRALRSMEPNCIVLVARDGSEAIDYLFRTGPFEGLKTQPRPDLVILDLNLPKVGGLEVLKKIRENNATSLLPVVVFSSNSEQKNVDASYRLGVNSFVHKPLDYDEFIESVRLIGRYWLGFSHRSPHSSRQDGEEPIPPIA